MQFNVQLVKSMEGHHFSEAESFQLDVIGAITQCDYDIAKTLVDNEVHVKALREIGWDLVSKVCELLSDETAKDSLQLRVCEHILQRACTVGNPKELLLALLEQIDRFKSDYVFSTLLLPLQTCLLALPTRPYHSISLVVDTLVAHLSTVTIDCEQVLEGDERKLWDNGDEVSRMHELALAFLHFLSAFIAHDVSEKLRHKLSLCLYQVLDVAVARCDVTHGADGWEPKLRQVADKASTLLVTLNRNLYAHLLQFRSMVVEQEAAGADRKPNTDEEDDDAEEQVSALGASTFAFIIFAERHYFTLLPQVFTHHFWFELTLTFTKVLLDCDAWLAQRKGVMLFSQTIDRVAQDSLPAAFFGIPKVKLALQSLLKVVCTCASKAVSQRGLLVFRKFLWSFDASGRAAFVLFVLRKSQHSGVVGYVITQLKEMIHRNLATGATQTPFRAPHLSKLLRVAFELPDAERTDLVEHSDRVISSLNLLLYLVLRDARADDVTGIWTLLPEVERGFCEQLRTGINMSKAHYEMELQRVRSGKNDPKAGGDVEVELSVGGEVLPAMPKEHKVQMLTVGLRTFDVMQSILGRISDRIAAIEHTNS